MSGRWWRRAGGGLLLLLAAAWPAFAIDPALPLGELIEAHWGQAAGLAQDTVYTLVQTRDGFLWAGTRAGLSRFDGVLFRNFGRAELPLERTARVQALAEDAAGALWIGTGGGELLRYRDGIFEAFGPAEGLAVEGRPVGRITAIAAGPTGEVWVGTHLQGVFRFAGERFERVAASAEIAPITRVALDENGDLWISTMGQGVFCYRPGAPLLNLRSRDGLPSDFVGAVVPARGGGVWLATNGGVGRYRDGRLAVWGEAQGLTNSHITALREDRHGNVWLATFGSGLQRLRPDGGIERLQSGEAGASDIAWEVYEDHSGAIWLGTVEAGLRLFTVGAFSTWRARGDGHGLSSRLVTTLAEDEAGTFFVGTRDGGLNWRRGDQFGRIGPDQGLAAATVWALASEGGVLWIGTEQGLFRRSAEGVAAWPLPFFERPPAVFALLPTAANLWVGTDQGLLRLPRQDGEAPRRFTTFDGLPAAAVRDLELDATGRLWIATAAGVATLDHDTLRRQTELDPTAYGEPIALHRDARGAMWVITNPGGLSRLSGGRAERVGVAEGLLDASLYAITEDAAGFFWLGTSRGVVRVERAALEARLGRPGASLPQMLFDRFDGVAPGAIEAPGKGALVSRDGRVLLATFGGVAVFDPRRQRPAAAPAALIESLTVDGVPAESSAAASGSSRASFSSDHRAFTFALAAPMPHAGAKIHLRYRLVGFDKVWVEAGAERSVTYTGLVPGYYRFEAQASTLDGSYLTPPSQLPFSIAAGFYQSWRFPLALSAALAAAAALFHRWRALRLRARERELAARIARATADLKTLHKLLPLCGSCHQVRDDQGYWQQVESYLAKSTEFEFTHSYCPDCARHLYDELEAEAAEA